jgi:tetratricopeptide (TPR) repeat protein
MKRVRYALLLVSAAFLLSCSTPSSIYLDNMFWGKKALDETDYQQAKDCFMKAAEAYRNASALAFAATASYKLGDLSGAEQTIGEAERLDRGHTFDGRYFPSVRIMGYKALILLTEEREDEGIESLSQYLEMYKHIHSGSTVREIEVMVRKRQFNLARLEVLIDDEVKWYEDDVDQYLRTGTGYYDRASRGGSRSR